MSKKLVQITDKLNETKAAFSIIELLVVLSVIAILVLLAIPAINAMQKSLNSGGAESMISTALATARTLAIKNNHYAGVRFQKQYNIKDPQINAAQYMIFVIFNTDSSNVGDEFHAIEGYKPIKLPENIGVIDMVRRTDNAADQYGPMTSNAKEQPLQKGDLDDSVLTNLDPNKNNMNITDTSAFSIVFSPSGKLVVHDIRIRNDDGHYRPPDLDTTKNGSDDKVFNSFTNIIINNTGQFVQDDYANYGLGGESSRQKFYIYDREKFEKMTDSAQRYNYLSGLKPININPYTGEIIK